MYGTVQYGLSSGKLFHQCYPNIVRNCVSVHGETNRVEYPGYPSFEKKHEITIFQNTSTYCKTLIPLDMKIIMS